MRNGKVRQAHAVPGVVRQGRVFILRFQKDRVVLSHKARFGRARRREAGLGLARHGKVSQGF
jgi:hypothetical protein